MAAVIGGAAPKCPSHRDAGVWWDIDCLYFRCSRCGAAVTDPLEAMAPTTTEDPMPEPFADPLPGNTCLEAASLVSGERAGQYGDAVEHFTAIVASFNALTGHNLKPSEGALLLTLLKLRRQTHKHKRDNCVDAEGYTDILYRCAEVEQHSEPSGQE